MRNILALVGAATLTFLVVGWYLGWYQIAGIPGPGGKQSVSIEVHTDKVATDVGNFADRVGEGVDSLRDKAKTEAKPATLTTPSGPASRFFGPTPETKPQASSGWRPIAPSEDEGATGAARPRN